MENSSNTNSQNRTRDLSTVPTIATRPVSTMPSHRPHLNQLAAQGNVATLQLLIDEEVDLNVSTPGGLTPLIAAARAGHHQVVRLLLDNGATPTAQALAAAQENGDKGIIRCIRKAIRRARGETDSDDE